MSTTSRQMTPEERTEKQARQLEQLVFVYRTEGEIGVLREEIKSLRKSLQPVQAEIEKLTLELSTGRVEVEAQTGMKYE